MANNVPSGTDMSAIRQLVPPLKQQLAANFDSDELQAIQAGLVYEFKFVTPSGFVPVDFTVDRNDLR